MQGECGVKWLIVGLIAGLFLGLPIGLSISMNVYRVEEPQVMEIYFSPNGGCEDSVLTWIGKANSSIHILIYSFTSDTVGDALLRATERVVEVKVVFEKSQISEYSEYQRLRDAGVEVRNDTNSRLMHNKVMIVDGIVVLTGSFNWSSSAQNYNDENLVVLRSRPVANSYEIKFQMIWEESV